MPFTPSPNVPDKRCEHCGEGMTDGRVGRRKKYCSKRCRQAAHRAVKRRDMRVAQAAEVREDLIDAADHLRRKTEDLIKQLYGHPSLRSAGADEVVSGWEKRINSLAVGTEGIAHRIAELAERHRQLCVEINERTQRTQQSRRNPPPEP